jgi:hypothetical protein
VVAPWWARTVLPRRVAVLVPGPRSNHPLLSAGAMTAALCLAWGCLIGACAGAAAGTLIVPLLGTIYGGAIGAPIGAVVGSAWAPLTVTVLAVRHRRVPSPHATLPDVARVLGVLPVLLGVISVAVVVGFLGSDSPAAAIWAAAVVVATMTVVIRLLRAAAVSISRAWCSRFGWQRA